MLFTDKTGFGVTHISRPEDWPIMPVEILRAHLKPSGFFDVSLVWRQVTDRPA
jgi:Cu2+-containing amine oxidase